MKDYKNRILYTTVAKMPILKSKENYIKYNGKILATTCYRSIKYRWFKLRNYDYVYVDGLEYLNRCYLDGKFVNLKLMNKPYNKETTETKNNQLAQHLLDYVNKEIEADIKDKELIKNSFHYIEKCGEINILIGIKNIITEWLNNEKVS